MNKEWTNETVAQNNFSYDFEKVKEYCHTPTQTLIVESVIKNRGNCTLAAAELGKSPRRIQEVWQLVKSRMAVSGYAPDNGIKSPVPHPFFLKGMSQLRGPNEEVVMTWYKSQIDLEKKFEIVKDYVSQLNSEVQPIPEVKSPSVVKDDLCNLYTMTDCHMGMLAWHKEGGADWDIKIATRILGGCFKASLDAAPPAKVGIVNQLGDFLHTDGFVPITPTAGNILDADSRYPKIVSATNDLLIQLVIWALEKHEEVVVLMAEGNHDMNSSVWLQDLFVRLFKDNPRVKVIQSALPYYAYRHGETMLAFHHGHMKKNPDLPLFFAAAFSDMWGKTSKRYCHVGHRHHKDEKDYSGMRVTQHSTLAARDAYASRHGWMSEREMTTITYHKKHGQVMSNTVIPEMLED